jgi:ATP-dependent Clp protease ATP-binding subunit ClpB
VDFKNVVIVLTSNIGSHHIQAIEDKASLAPADKKELIHRAVTEEVRKAFKPEFVNRLDEIVVFQRLDRAQIRQIVDIQLGLFSKRLARRELFLDLTERAKDSLGDVGYDPQFGARPLKRAIQKYLEDALAKKVLAGEFVAGSTIRVDGDAVGGFSFSAPVQN